MAIWAAHGAAASLASAPAECSSSGGGGGDASGGAQSPLTPGAVAGIAIACVAVALWITAMALYYCGGAKGRRGIASGFDLIEKLVPRPAHGRGGGALGYQPEGAAPPASSKRGQWRYHAAQTAAPPAQAGYYEDL